MLHENKCLLISNKFYKRGGRGAVVSTGEVQQLARARCSGQHGRGAVVSMGEVPWLARARCSGQHGRGAVVSTGVVQWLANLTCNRLVVSLSPISKADQLVLWTRNLTLFWFSTGQNQGMIYICKIACFTIKEM